MKFMTVKDAIDEIVVQRPRDIYENMIEERSIDRECFYVLHLNARNQIIEKELVSMGTLNASLVHPRETFKKMIVNGTASFITVHNHPSGECQPSAEDIGLWKRLNSCGELLGIECLDHMVIAKKGYASAKELNLM